MNAKYRNIFVCGEMGQVSINLMHGIIRWDVLDILFFILDIRFFFMFFVTLLLLTTFFFFAAWFTFIITLRQGQENLKNIHRIQMTRCKITQMNLVP